MSKFCSFNNHSMNLFMKTLKMSRCFKSNDRRIYIFANFYKEVGCVNFLCIRGNLIIDDCLVLYMCFVSEIRLFLTMLSMGAL